MKYFLEYVLGWRSPPNKKAEKGTIVHKVLEILAHIKLCRQSEGQVSTFTDDIVGLIPCNRSPHIEHITEQVYDYYSTRSPNQWEKEEDLKECIKWVKIAINYNDGEFNPLNSHIVMPEQSFDFCITQPWAMYEYETPSGKMEGFLGVKGTIDQVSRIDQDTYMILDWKTGRRWNWAKDYEKDHDNLKNDPQLMMYYYAAQHLYPHIPYIIVTIYFINDGGPFVICFSKDDVPRIERMLQKKFEDIKHTEIPRRQRSWKCSKFCHYGMHTFDGTNMPVITETRPDQVCAIGSPMTMCEQTAYCLDHRPVDSVIKHMSAPGHNVDYYSPPGKVE